MARQLRELLGDVQIPQRIEGRLGTSRNEDFEKVGGCLVADEEAEVVRGGGSAVGVLDWVGLSVRRAESGRK